MKRTKKMRKMVSMAMTKYWANKTSEERAEFARQTSERMKNWWREKKEAERIEAEMLENSKSWKWYNRHPEIAAKWHPTNNRGVKPEDVTTACHDQFWWLDTCGHSYRASMAQMLYGNKKCPMCEGKELVIGFNDLATTNPELAKEWNWDKNGSLRPDQVPFGYTKKVWWKCPVCGYEYKASVKDRVNGKAECLQCKTREDMKTMDFDQVIDLITEAYNEFNHEKNVGKVINLKSNEKIHWTSMGGKESCETVLEHIARKIG